MSDKIQQMREEWFRNSCGSYKEFDAILGLILAITSPKREIPVEDPEPKASPKDNAHPVKAKNATKTKWAKR